MDLSSRVQKIEELLKKKNLPSFRQKQIFEAIYQKHLKFYAEMTTLPKDLRQLLTDELGPQVLSLKHVSETKDGQADKVLFETQDKNRLEAVLMTFKPKEERSNEHQSLCLSSQSGCGLGCTFCATGAIGFKKNLAVDEITDQILYFLQQNRSVTNLSFMGMGEPFANPHLFDALKIITDKDKLAYSQRHLSISTVGLIPGIKRLQKEFPEINLAFSLHSPFPKQRLELMPITGTYSVETVMQALKEFVEETNKRVFIAYILLKDVNDSLGHAKELARLIKDQGEKAYLYHVNLIRFNPGLTFQTFKKPSTQRVNVFRKALTGFGIENTLRQSFGSEIKAACGQLYGQYEKTAS